MAIPATPSSFYLQSGNRQNYLSWDLSTGATSYSIQRSTDGITYSNYDTSTTNSYLDIVVTAGTQYWYQVGSTNLSGTSPYTTPQSIVPTPTSEVSLGQLRLMAQQRADLVNSNFITLPEWNSYINQSMYELYDLLITADEEYFVATPVQFLTDGTSYQYPLPDGVTSFTNGISLAPGYIAPAFYKLKGVDLGINSSANAYVTVNKFTFIDRNRYVYPNTASTIYGVFNLQYRLLGANIQFIPTPSTSQPIRLWYIPRLNQMLKDTDITTTSISGWIEYVVVDAAIKAMQKEESDVTVLLAQKLALIKRIEETATNRDTGMPDRVSDVRQNGYWGSTNGGYGFNGPIGGI